MNNKASHHLWHIYFYQSLGRKSGREKKMKPVKNTNTIFLEYKALRRLER